MVVQIEARTGEFFRPSEYLDNMMQDNDVVLNSPICSLYLPNFTLNLFRMKVSRQGSFRSFDKLVLGSGKHRNEIHVWLNNNDRYNKE